MLQAERRGSISTVKELAFLATKGILDAFVQCFLQLKFCRKGREQEGKGTGEL